MMTPTFSENKLFLFLTLAVRTKSSSHKHLSWDVLVWPFLTLYKICSDTLDQICSKYIEYLCSYLSEAWPCVEIAFLLMLVIHSLWIYLSEWECTFFKGKFQGKIIIDVFLSELRYFYMMSYTNWRFQFDNNNSAIAIHHS